MNKSWQGFDGRVFLTEEEHAAYLRRPPVRYSRANLIGPPLECSVCGQEFSTDNPAQVSHLIPFIDGVRIYGLTSDWLDSPENLVWAHRRRCNALAELSKAEINERIRELEPLEY